MNIDSYAFLSFFGHSKVHSEMCVLQINYALFGQRHLLITSTHTHISFLLLQKWIMLFCALLELIEIWYSKLLLLP